MKYASYLIKETRLQKQWSQESVCKDICTPSYLSKIEQGKVEASQEIIDLLFQRLGICWNEIEDGRRLVEEAYDLLFSYELQQFIELCQCDSFVLLEDSEWGMDYLLFQAMIHTKEPVNREFEQLFDTRQLSLQRLLQKQYQEAIHLYPCAYIFLSVGMEHYHQGDYTKAIEYLHQANTLACNEGRVQIMLQSRMIMGSCYSNRMDFESMKHHYEIAKRLARTLKDQESLDVMQYNYAATCMEAGFYEQALSYFKTKKESKNLLELHKLAICYEKIDKKEEALKILNRADGIFDDSLHQIESKMCHVVKMRLEQEEYLKNEEYGKLLLETFELCSTYASRGFAIFHIPWLVEWYEYHRQYKKVVNLLQNFPRFSKK